MSGITVMPAEFCDAMEICVAITHAIPWSKVGAVVAILAFAYGVAMSIAFFLYAFRFRGQRKIRRTGPRT